MSDFDFDTISMEQDIVNSGFFEEATKFWFEDKGHIRSPFPAEIHEKLKKNTIGIFLKWMHELNEQERARLEDNTLVETFEMILFNQALDMVTDDEQRITISYPFLPRPGDPVDDKENGPSVVLSRELKVNDNEKKYLKLTLENKTSRNKWETEFELPA